MDSQVVPYDPTETSWKMARLMSHVNPESLSESMIFTPRRKKMKKIETLEEKLREAQKREAFLAESYDELLEHYNELLDYIKLIQPNFATVNLRL